MKGLNRKQRKVCCGYLSKRAVIKKLRKEKAATRAATGRQKNDADQTMPLVFSMTPTELSRERRI